MSKQTWNPRWAAMAATLAVSLLVASRAQAHCDTMDGPVVADARAALDKGDVTGTLRWVKAENEAEIKAAFAKSLAVRGKGPEAKELADLYFFETLVRVHRAGEGAPYTGLKPAGTPTEPGVAESDKALAGGNVDELVKAATEAVAAGIRERFAKVIEAKKHSDHSVDAGRKFVAAYVEFVHYVERILAAAGTADHHHDDAGKTPAAVDPHKGPAEHHEPPAHH